jgi:hypothetical protein
MNQRTLWMFLATMQLEVVMSPGVAELPPRERAVVLAMLLCN